MLKQKLRQAGQRDGSSPLKLTPGMTGHWQTIG